MSSSSTDGEKSGKNQEQHKRYNSSHLPDIESMQKQPLNIREGDLAYQFHRVVVFARLLASYPYKKDQLYKECRIDIPPIYRNLAWCALLNVPFNSTDVYFKINKEVITSTGSIRLYFYTKIELDRTWINFIKFFSLSIVKKLDFKKNMRLISIIRKVTIPNKLVPG